MTPSAPPLPEHDADRCARLYRQCKPAAVNFARRLLTADRLNRHLCAFDAEEFYDSAWETYYNRREYMEDRDDHVARLNVLIVSRYRDERRRSRAQKRRLPGRAVDVVDAERTTSSTARPGTRRGIATDGVEDGIAARDELRELLGRVRNPADAQALIDHEVGGLTFAEIGAREGITAEAARRRAKRAIEQAGRQQDER